MSYANPTHLRGIFYALVSYTLWVLVDALLKGVGEAGVPPFESVGVIGAVTVLVMFVKVRITEPSLEKTIAVLWPRRFKMPVILSIVAFLAQYLCVLALPHLPLTIFYVTVFTAPLMIAILSTVFLGERMGILKALAVIVGFIGVIIAALPEDTGGGDWIGYAATFGSALFFAIAVVLSRVLMRSVTAESFTFFNAGLQALLSLFFLACTDGWIHPVPSMLALLVVAGLINTAGNFFNYRAVQYAPAGIVGAYHYSQIISGALVAFLVWNEVPTWRMVSGILVILVSGLYIALSSKRRKLPNPSLLS